MPETVSPGRGRRAARLPGREPNAARIVRRLEGAVVDFDVLPITALDRADARIVHAKVAGPAALPTTDFAARYRRVLADDRSRDAGERGRGMLAELFHRGGDASAMAAAAAAGLLDPDEVRLSCELLSQDLLSAIADG